MADTPSGPPSQAAPGVRLSSSRQWPGDWEPTGLEVGEYQIMTVASRLDTHNDKVHEANQSPENTFRERFKVALLQSEDGQECFRREPFTQFDVSQTADSNGDGPNLLASSPSPDRVYTYPMSMLSDVPTIPDTDEVARLQAAFFTSFKQHIFIDAIAIPDSTLTSPAPYLQLALACLAAEIAPYTDPMGYNLGVEPSRKTEVASALFHAGMNLWGVVMEVDNRETRRLEAMITAYLFVTYAILSTQKENWRISCGLVHNTATLARRLRLTDGFSQPSSSGESLDRSLVMKSSLMAYMFLTDIVHAIYCDAAPTYSTSEICIKMPLSNHSFRTVYRALLHGHSRLPDDVRSREDCLLLLTALLNDIVYLHRCNPPTPSPSPSISLERITGGDTVADHQKPLQNPYTPLSARSEFSRMSAQIRAALERWIEHFGQVAEKDILALYHFSHLCLVCPDIAELSSLAGYDPGLQFTPIPPQKLKQSQMSDKALDLAWLVLDSCDIQSEPTPRRLSIWLPMVLFLSALVIWQRLRHRPSNDFKYGTLKVLSMFKNEILQLPWPCCPSMAITLDRLMKE